MIIGARSLAFSLAVGLIACEAAAAPSSKAVKAAHPGIEAAHALIAEIRAGKYAQAIYPFSSDAEFDEPRRTAAFRELASYITSRDWTVELASIQYSQGVEDAVDVWLRAADGAWLALYVGYEYRIKQWRVGGYEYPMQTFDRKGMTLDAYVAASKEHLRSLPPTSAHKNGKDGEFRLVPAAR